MTAPSDVQTQDDGKSRPPRDHLSEFFAVFGVVAALVLFIGAGTYNAITTYHPPDSRSTFQIGIVTALGALDDGDETLQLGSDMTFSFVQLGFPVVCFMFAWRLRSRSRRFNA